MEEKEFLIEYSEVVNYSKEFKAIAAYLLITENPNIEDLEANVITITDNPKFKLWEYLRDYESKFHKDKIGYKNLVGFFRNLEIDDMEKFIHNKVGQMLFSYLEKNECKIRVYWKSTSEDLYDKVEFKCGNKRIYFWHPNSFYSRIDLDIFFNRVTFINDDILKINKIEKNNNGEWTPTIIKINNKHFLLNELANES